MIAGKLYRGVADGLLLTVIVVLLASTALYFIRQTQSRLRPPPGLNPEMLASAHPHLSKNEIRQMLDETYYEGAWTYSPYVGFTETPRNGRFVSVSPEGFRWGPDRTAKLSGPEPRICLFGGSTMFGYGVDDAHTIGANLQHLLDRDVPARHLRVLNLGHGSYYSEQEAILYHKLLLQGRRCAVALFFDGWNENQVEPKFSVEQKVLFDDNNRGPGTLFLLAVSQLTLFRDINNRSHRGEGFAVIPPDAIVQRYRKARETIRRLATADGAQQIFVIQPAPGFRNRFLNYPLKREYCVPGSSCQTVMATRMGGLAALAKDVDTFDLTGLFGQWETLPFIDEIHYSPKANSAVAAALEEIILRGQRMPALVVKP